MAFPASFAESNETLGTPEGLDPELVGALSVLRVYLTNGTPLLVSCWKLTEAELNAINRTGRVWLAVMGDTMPPVIVTGEKPFSGAET